MPVLKNSYIGIFSLLQTALVDGMLYQDRQMELYNSLHNLLIYNVELSSGTFTGTHNQLMIKKAGSRKVLEQGTDEALVQDIDLKESARAMKGLYTSDMPYPIGLPGS